MTANVATLHPPLVGVLGIDHVVLRVVDLDEAERLWRSLGFALTPRGFHAGRGSANHTAPFHGGNYVELIRVDDGDTPFARKAQGPVAVALRPQSSRALAAELAGRGHRLDPPRDLARPVTLDGVTRDARFLNLTLPRVGVEDLRLFACEHLTPDLVRRPEWQFHANGAAAVRSALAVAVRPERFAAAYGALLGSDVVRRTEAGLSIDLGLERLEIVSPDAFAARFPGLTPQGDLDAGSFVGLSLDADPTRVAAAAAAAGLASRIETDGRVVLAPETALGTLIEFVAR